MVEITRSTAWWRERIGVPHFIRVTNDHPEIAGMTVMFTPGEWRAFIDGVKSGEFDLDDDGNLPAKAPASGS